MVEQAGKTVILMLHPSSILARGSHAKGVAATLESELIGIIERTFVEGHTASAPDPASITP